MKSSRTVWESVKGSKTRPLPLELVEALAGSGAGLVGSEC